MLCCIECIFSTSLLRNKHFFVICWLLHSVFECLVQCCTCFYQQLLGYLRAWQLARLHAHRRTQIRLYETTTQMTLGIFAGYLDLGY